MDVCEVVSSIHNKNKINDHGYLMVKDKNRGQLYYWYCEKWDILNCKGRATTLFAEDQHQLVKISEHNHTAETSRVKVIKSINLLKERPNRVGSSLPCSSPASRMAWVAAPMAKRVCRP